MTNEEEMWRIASRYCGGDPRLPRMVRVSVLSLFPWSNEWTPAEFLAEVSDAVAQIPPDAQNAKVDWDGDESPWLSMTFDRIETADEVTDRIGRALAYACEAMAEDRATYDRLRRKFGDNK